MEPVVKARQLLEKALRYLEVARAVMPIDADTAINRAYYAMFHAAQAALLAQHGLEFSKHSAVHSAFGKYFAKTGRVPRHIHKLLIKAYWNRQGADYGLGITFTVDEVKQRLAEAEEFIRAVRQLVEEKTT